MAHFAELNENNIVTQVIVVDNKDILDETGNESETKGIEFCKNLFGGYKWIQTSYNSSFRGVYAGVGYRYDETNDVFFNPDSPIEIEKPNKIEEISEELKTALGI